MKKVFFVLAAGLVLMTSCLTTPAGDNAVTDEEKAALAAIGDTLLLDAGGSSIGWVASKPGSQHNGTFNIANGFVTVANGSLTGGKIDIDVTSLQVLDLTGEDKNSLENHLKSADFFLIDSFPTATFQITNVSTFDSAAQSTLPGATHTISGNLTMRGKTNNVTFPALVKTDGGRVTAVADFTIDRTQWGLVYKGPNNPTDWFIAKEVNLKLDIKAGSGGL